MYGTAGFVERSEVLRIEAEYVRKIIEDERRNEAWRSCRSLEQVSEYNPWVVRHVADVVEKMNPFLLHCAEIQCRCGKRKVCDCRN